MAPVYVKDMTELPGEELLSGENKRVVSHANNFGDTKYAHDLKTDRAKVDDR